MLYEKIRTSPWREGEHSPCWADNVPTMLSAEERHMLKWIAENAVEGYGCVVDLGSFLGGSTSWLAEGLLARANRPTDSPGAALRKVKLHAYDNFQISEDLKSKYLYPAGVEPFAGTDMLDLFRKHIRPYEDFVEIHPGELKSQTLPDGPVEVLFVDIMKSWDTADYVNEKFLPLLIPNKSVIVQQDYLWWKNPWVAITMEALSPKVEFLCATEENSVLFGVTEEINRDDIERVRHESLRGGVMLDCLARAKRHFSNKKHLWQMDKAIEAVARNPAARTATELSK